jgi:hypothetical protein
MNCFQAVYFNIVHEASTETVFFVNQSKKVRVSGSSINMKSCLMSLEVIMQTIILILQR